MGTLTVQQIFEQAGLQAGDESIDTSRQLIGFNEWLRETYMSWPWPFLHRHYHGLALVSGATSVTFGAGSGETNPVKNILAPIEVLSSDYSVRTRANFLPYVSGSAGMSENADNPATNLGTPTMFRARPFPTTWGKWTLYPNKIPTRDLILDIDYIVIPAALTLTDVPLFPSDRTLIQAAKCFILEWNDEPQLGGELAKLSEMVVNNRSRIGDSPGINDVYPLDQSVFR